VNLDSENPSVCWLLLSGEVARVDLCSIGLGRVVLCVIFYHDYFSFIVDGYIGNTFFEATTCVSHDVSHHKGPH
jgi:hypothetical protein